MPSDFQQLKAEVEKGILGKTQGIPIALRKLGKYLSIRQSVYTLIGGFSGTGKTGLTDSIYVLEPYMWLLENMHKTDIRIEWVYRSMERKKLHKLGKWCCYYLWRKYGVLIEPAKLMGWKQEKITSTEKDYFDSCEEFLQVMQDSKIVTIIDGQENPREVFLHLRDYALARGAEEQISEHEKRYTLNNPNLIIVPVVDTVGKCKLETVDGSKDRKSTTDKMSEYASILRDRYHQSPILISQFNTSITSQIYGKHPDPEPTPESYKNSGNMFEDCDVALALFNPYRYKIMDHMGYDIPKMVDKSGGPHHGANYFRSLKLLKSSFSEDDLRFGLAFMGQIGMFKDLQRADEMDDSIYDGIKALMYFIND